MSIQEVIEIVAPVCLVSSMVGTMLGMSLYKAAFRFVRSLYRFIDVITFPVKKNK
mgnify:CR=1 FL=1